MPGVDLSDAVGFCTVSLISHTDITHSHMHRQYKLKNVGNHTAVKTEAGSSCGSCGKKQRHVKRKYVNNIEGEERHAYSKEVTGRRTRGRLKKH